MNGTSSSPRPECRKLHESIRHGLGSIVVDIMLLGVTDPRLKPEDASEALVQEGINLIAAALLATGQSPDFDQLAADGVRLQLFDALRRQREIRT